MTEVGLMHDSDSDSPGEFFLKFFAFFIALGFAGLIFSAIINMVIADGKVQYCYTQYYTGGNGGMPHYTLFGFRPWRADSTIGIYTTLDETVAAAQKTNCKINGAE